MLFGTVPVFLGNYDEPVSTLFTSPVVGPKDMLTVGGGLPAALNTRPLLRAAVEAAISAGRSTSSYSNSHPGGNRAFCKEYRHSKAHEKQSHHATTKSDRNKGHICML